VLVGSTDAHIPAARRSERTRRKLSCWVEPFHAEIRTALANGVRRRLEYLIAAPAESPGHEGSHVDLCRDQIPNAVLFLRPDAATVADPRRFAAVADPPRFAAVGDAVITVMDRATLRLADFDRGSITAGSVRLGPQRWPAARWCSHRLP
jgi:hypothetical protein